MQYSKTEKGEGAREREREREREKVDIENETYRAIKRQTIYLIQFNYQSKTASSAASAMTSYPS